MVAFLLGIFLGSVKNRPEGDEGIGKGENEMLPPPCCPSYWFFFGFFLERGSLPSRFGF